MMNKDELFDLLIYMVVSAAGLKDEPQIYGPLRLIEASERLAGMIKSSVDPDNPALDELIGIIEAHKDDCMYDQDAFYNMLDEASVKLLDCTK